MNVVIMAGGGGSRLWPLSRQSKPKQFLDLGSGKTLLEQAWDRARVLADVENIFVATTREYGDKVREVLPQVLEENMTYEPMRRDTGPALALSAIMLDHKGKGDEPVIFMWSDHVFTNEEALMEDLKKIPQLLEEHENTVVIAGHNPVFPETGLGYIEVGEKLEGHKDTFWVKAFKEKPDKETAQRYVEAGNYFWNMAYVSVKPKYLLSELYRNAPETMKCIEVCRDAVIASDTETFDASYSKCDPISIDYILLEKTPRIIAVTGDYGWNDVGNWSAVHSVFGVTGDHMPKGHHVHVDSDENYVYNTTGTCVSLVGLKNTIVVVTEDATLIMDKNSAHKVKDVVERLKKDGLNQYL